MIPNQVREFLSYVQRGNLDGCFLFFVGLWLHIYFKIFKVGVGEIGCCFIYTTKRLDVGCGSGRVRALSFL